MTIEHIFSHIESHKKQYLEELFTLIRQPSISSQNKGVRDCAALLADMVSQCYMKTRIIETSGQPIVYGEKIVDKNRPTILFYGHYDVQPPEPLNLWNSPPFEPTLKDGKIFARGSVDDKGQLIAHILGLRSCIAVIEDFPLNIKFVFEGEEESGSPFLDSFVKERKEMLLADLVFTSDGSMHETGSPDIILGARGLQSIEITSYGAKWDNHSGNKGGIVPNPVWPIVSLLETIRNKNGKILIKGFYDNIKKPSKNMMDLIYKLPFNKDRIIETTGYDGFDLDKETYFSRLMFEPTLNINGITSGYSGDGIKTIIPSKAVLKMDIRLVPDQDPDDILAKFKTHVKKYFPELEVTDMGSMKPSITNPDLPVVNIVSKAVERAFEIKPVLVPSMGGSLPNYVWTKTLGIPSIIVPYGNADGANHSPNENFDVELFFKGIKCSCSVMCAFAGID